nr:ribonuclease HII [Luteimicrobium subarcticum]
MRGARSRTAHLRQESAWIEAGARTVAGMDEVGRGALAGPVSVGVVVVDVATKRPPRGLTDSKLLSVGDREGLVPRVSGWAVASAVGHASSAEIDTVGIIGALRLAGRRALAEIAATGVHVDAVLLDGSHDWLSDPVPDLLDQLAADAAEPLPAPVPPLGVRTLVKADVQCASVAGASVLAKCTRDALMRELAVEHPGYAWEQNKGYASAAHVRALGELGASVLHRTSWNLPGLAPAAAVRADDDVLVGSLGPEA